MCEGQGAGEVCISGVPDPKTTGEETTYEGHQRDSKFTDLLDDALRCAIAPYRHDPVVGPPDIKDTTHGLQKVEREKGELSCKNLMSRAKGSRLFGQTM